MQTSGTAASGTAASRTRASPRPSAGRAVRARAWWSVVGALVLVVAVTACTTSTPSDEGLVSGPEVTASATTDSPGTTGPRPDEDGPPTSPPSTTGSGRDDAAIARAAMLTLTNLPPGWTETPATPSGDADEAFDLPECGDIAPTLDRLAELETADEQSPTFEDPTATRTVEQTINAASDEGEVARYLDLLEDESLMRACLTALFDQEFAAGVAGEVELAGVAITPLVLPRIGEERVGYEIRIDLTAPPVGTLSYYAEFVFVRIDTFVLGLSFTSEREPFPITERATVLNVAVARLAGELA